jgi:hypothetical protein
MFAAECHTAVRQLFSGRENPWKTQWSLVKISICEIFIFSSYFPHLEEMIRIKRNCYLLFEFSIWNIFSFSPGSPARRSPEKWQIRQIFIWIRNYKFFVQDEGTQIVKIFWDWILMNSYGFPKLHHLWWILEIFYILVLWKGIAHLQAHWCALLLAHPNYRTALINNPNHGKGQLVQSTNTWWMGWISKVPW